MILIAVFLRLSFSLVYGELFGEEVGGGVNGALDVTRPFPPSLAGAVVLLQAEQKNMMQRKPKGKNLKKLKKMRVIFRPILKRILVFYSLLAGY